MCLRSRTADSNHVFAQQWPAAGSGGDDDVRFVQVPGDFIQRDGVSGILLSQFLRSFQGTVGDDHLVQAAVVQVFCDKFNRFTGADQQCRMPGQVAEYLPGQTNCSVSNGHRVVPNHGVAAYVLGYLERMLEQAVQHFADTACFPGRLVCLFQLAQDLRLSHDHRVQAAGYAQTRV